MTIVQEAIDTADYNELAREAHTIDVNDEKSCDDLLEKIEIKLRLKIISEEQVRYLTRIVCSR